LSEAEISKAENISKIVEAVDGNVDGTLSEAEISKAENISKIVEAVDGNVDGTLSEAEMCAFYSKMSETNCTEMCDIDDEMTQSLIGQSSEALRTLLQSLPDEIVSDLLCTMQGVKRLPFRMDNLEFFALKDGEDINDPAWKSDGLGRMSRLCYAAKEVSSGVVQRLVDMGADVNQRGCYDGLGPLHCAVQGNLENVQLLLSLGADVNVPDDWGNQPLHSSCSCWEMSAEIVQCLVDAKADVNAITTNSKNGEVHSPLTCVNKICDDDKMNDVITAVARILIDNGADKNYEFQPGMTVFDNAYTKGKPFQTFIAGYTPENATEEEV
jgi:hypothetical protein